MSQQRSFRSDDLWQRVMRDRYLTPFYEHIAEKFIYIEGEEDSCAMVAQKELGVDTVLQRDGKSIFIEEKIVRWPKDGKPHTAFALEMMSCTVSGREKTGWMLYSAADKLLYCFETKRGGKTYLMAYLIPMQPLRGWAMQRRDPALPYMIDEKYPKTITDQVNRSECRVVDIGHVVAAIEGVRVYQLNENCCGVYRKEHGAWKVDVTEYAA